MLNTILNEEQMNKVKSFLKKRTVILGIGNILKGDDGVGIEIVNKLQGVKLPQNIKLIDAGVVPENYIASINDFGPEIVLLIDAVYFDAPAGMTRLFEEKDLEFYGFSTHNMSPKLFIQAVKQREPYFQ